MRVFVFLLLISNVLLWSWYRYRAPAIAPSQAATPSMGEMRLLSEIDPAGLDALAALTDEPPPASPPGPPARGENSEGRVIEPKPATPEPPNSPQCVVATGVDAVGALQALAAKWAAQGHRVMAQGEVQATREQFWVMLPPFRTSTEAHEVAARLRGRAVKDYYVVREGESRNAISLGVFSTREAAERRQAEIAGLRINGLKPRIQILERPATKQWLKVRPGEGLNPPTLPPGTETLILSEGPCD